MPIPLPPQVVNITIIITVIYTAQLKAALNTASEEIKIRDGATVNKLLTLLADRHGDLFRSLVFDAQGGLLPSVLLCRGDEQIGFEEEAPLADGDSVTLLSAISGG